MATRAGGFVGGDQRRSADADAVAELQLRVPADRSSPAWSTRSPKLGRQQQPGHQHRGRHRGDRRPGRPDRHVSGPGWTARRRLLARATSITDLVSLENELGRREADLASLEAKKRRLADLTALSTITAVAGRAGRQGRRREGRDRLPGRAEGRLEGVRRLVDRPAHRAGRAAAVAGGARRTAWRCLLLVLRRRRKTPALGRVRSARRRQCPQRGLHHDAYAGRDGPLVHVEASTGGCRRWPAGAAHAEPDHRAGHLLQVEAKSSPPMLISGSRPPGPGRARRRRRAARPRWPAGR